MNSQFKKSRNRCIKYTIYNILPWHSVRLNGHIEANDSIVKVVIFGRGFAGLKFSC